MIEYRQATMEDGLVVLGNLRDEQRRTIAKLNVDAEALLEKALGNEYPSMTVVLDGEPAAMFGAVSDTLLGEVKLWMLVTPLVDKCPVACLRASRRMTQSLFETYGSVVGIVDRDFEKSRQWLRWIGFKEVRLGEYIVMRYSGGH